MSEWSIVSIGDLFDLIPGYAFKSSDFIHEGVPVVKIKNIKAGRFSEHEFSYVATQFLKERSGKLAIPGDLLISMSGNRHDGSPETWVGKIAPFRKDGNYFINQRVGALRRKPKANIDVRFASFLLASIRYQELFIAIATSSGGQANLSPQQILATPLSYPPLSTQIAIGELLGALDDKIDLNQRMNDTLEAMARAIFKDWFVDFGPVRAKAEGRQPPGLAPDIAALFPDALNDDDKPTGWQVSDVYKVADVIYGAPFASDRFNSVQRGLPLIRIRDLSDHSPDVFTDERHPKATLIEAGDIVVGMDGEFRLHVWRGPKALLNQRVCSFRPKQGVPVSFLAEALKQPLAFFERGKVGTTVIHLGKADIDTFRLVGPPEPVFQAYGGITDPLVARYVANSSVTRTLAALRDLLLPKLMSGEIRIRDADRTVEAAA